MRFLSPLHRLICIFHRLLRMLMHRLVVFFAGPMRGIASTLPSEGASFSGLGESVVLKRGWDLVGFQVNTLLEKFLGHCPKKNIPPRCHSFRMCSDGKTERYRTALGGASGICHLAVLLVFICRFALVLHSMIHKDLFRRFLVGIYVLAFFVLLFGLTRYSYRAKELLVCWLLLCSFFAVVALMFLGAVLAWYAGKYLVRWVSVAKTIIPELAVRFAGLPQEAISGLEILVAGTLNAPASTDASLDALGAHSGILIEVALQPMRVSESEQTLSCTQTNMP